MLNITDIPSLFTAPSDRFTVRRLELACDCNPKHKLKPNCNPSPYPYPNLQPNPTLTLTSYPTLTPNPNPNPNPYNKIPFKSAFLDKYTVKIFHIIVNGSRPHTDIL